MKKILLAFDGRHYSEGALEFANRLNQVSPILLTGAFIPQIDYANLWSFSAGGGGGSLFIPLVEESDAQTIADNIKKFESFCVKHHIEHRVHKDFYDFALPELKRETRFADLLLLSSETFYKQLGTDRPNDYLKEVLHSVECPVIVVPEKSDFPQTTILSYDGSGSSVYAIKQFAYLFPELVNNPTILVHAKEGKQDEWPDEQNIEELVSRHYSNLSLYSLELNPKKYFSDWMLENKGAILISGAFARSGISRFFRKSFVSDVIAEHQLPVFIAHR